MKIFLSYPSEQLPTARSVYTFVRGLNVDVWFDKESLVAGQDWNRERALAQKAADLFVLVCSKETVEKSGVIQREINDILEIIKDRPPGTVTLVSVRTEDVQLPPELSRFQYIDYFASDWQVRLSRSLSFKLSELGESNAAVDGFVGSATGSDQIAVHTLAKRSQRWSVETDYFSYSKKGDYWDYLNGEILTTAVRTHYENIADVQRSTTDEEDRPELYASFRAAEFFRLEELVSVRFYHENFLGGAHGNHWIQTENFGGADFGRVKLFDLLDGKADAIQFISEYSKLELKQRFLSEFPDLDFLSYPSEETELWDLYSNYNFNNQGLHFTLSPYAVLAYAFGVNTITIPWDDFRERLAPRYASSPLGRLMAASLD